VVQVESNLEGYKKFILITWLLHHPEEQAINCILEPNEFKDGELILTDGILRSTLAVRYRREATVRVRGDVGISVGILMRRDLVLVDGNLRRGDEKRVVFVKGNAKGYVDAKMTVVSL